MSGWLNDLNAEDRSRWDEFVESFRRDAVEKITGSAAFVSVLPEDEGDVKFWAELGCAVMLGKPIVAVALSARDVPEKLRLLADEVVESDIDTQDGASKLAAAIRKVLP